MEDEVFQSVTRSVWSEQLGVPGSTGLPYDMGNKTGGGIELEHERGLVTS